MLDRHTRIWTEVPGAERLSPQATLFDDFVEVVRPLVERYPNQILWDMD